MYGGRLGDEARKLLLLDVAGQHHCTELDHVLATVRRGFPLVDKLLIGGVRERPVKRLAGYALGSKDERVAVENAVDEEIELEARRLQMRIRGKAEGLSR